LVVMPAGVGKFGRFFTGFEDSSSDETRTYGQTELPADCTLQTGARSGNYFLPVRKFNPSASIVVQRTPEFEGIGQDLPLGESVRVRQQVAIRLRGIYFQQASPTGGVT